MHVLVAGCGYLGSALGVRLAAEGHVVWGLRRHPERLPTAIRPVEGDLRVPNTLRNLPKVDQIFYLASPDGDDPESLRAARIEGVGYLLAALAADRQRIRRVFYASSVSVYGPRGGDWVDEDSELRPEGADAEHLARAETLLREAPFPVTVVRLGELYGPGRLGLLDAVLGTGPVPGFAPTSHANLVHRDDAVGALRHLASSSKPERTYVAVDREPAPRLEILQWLATRLSRPMPAIDASAAAAVGPDVRAMSERLVESGFSFRYPSFREGYAPMLTKLGS